MCQFEIIVLIGLNSDNTIFAFACISNPVLPVGRLLVNSLIPFAFPAGNVNIKRKLVRFVTHLTGNFLADDQLVIVRVGATTKVGIREMVGLVIIRSLHNSTVNFVLAFIVFTDINIQITSRLYIIRDALIIDVISRIRLLSQDIFIDACMGELSVVNCKLSLARNSGVSNITNTRRKRGHTVIYRLIGSVNINATGHTVIHFNLNVLTVHDTGCRFIFQKSTVSKIAICLGNRKCKFHIRGISVFRLIQQFVDTNKGKCCVILPRLNLLCGSNR